MAGAEPQPISKAIMRERDGQLLARFWPKRWRRRRNRHDPLDAVGPPLRPATVRQRIPAELPRRVKAAESARPASGGRALRPAIMPPHLPAQARQGEVHTWRSPTHCLAANSGPFRSLHTARRLCKTSRPLLCFGLWFRHPCAADPPDLTSRVRDPPPPRSQSHLVGGGPEGTNWPIS